MHSLLKEKVLDFDGATSIVKQYTEYNMGTDSFVYSSE